MKSIAYIVTIHVIYGVFTANLDDKKKEELFKLQKQKNELFKLLNIAINETMNALEKSNETDAKQGMTFMKDLRQELKEINGTEIDPTDLSGNFLEETTSNKNNTNAIKIQRRTAHNDRLKPRILDFAKIFKKHSVAKKEKYVEYRESIQKKIEEWIAQRELEKKKIKEYKQRQRDQNRLRQEHCPDHGVDSKKKKKGSKGARNPKYPCCRKCCKKSYMGCL